MRIDIFSAPEFVEVVESVEWSGSFESYLTSVVPNWRDYPVQRFAVFYHGVKLPQDRWAEDMPPDTVLRVHVVPMGGVFKALGNIIGKLFSFLGFGQRGGTTRSDQPQQRELKASQGKANTAKLGSVVPEPMGRYRRFTDYLTPPRRYFASKREQWLVFLSNVGPGNYEILPDDVRVGQTPFDSLGGDASYAIFGPGADLSGYEPAEIWHTSDAVGGTSSGTAGLELTTEPANRVNTNPASYSFGGNVITRSDGAYPSGWGQDTQIQVEYFRSYTIVDFEYPPTESQPGYVISRITGYFGHLPNVAVGVQTNLGQFDVWSTWQIRTVVASPGSGMYTLEFQTVPGGVPIRINPGTQVLIFGAEVLRTVTFFADNAITVSPGNFQTATGMVTRLRFAGGTVYGEWTSEFVATPDGSATTLLELDVFFPRGLCELSDEGDVESRSVAIEYQYRPASGGTRTTVRYTYSDATVDQIGFTERLTIPVMVPSVRARRVGAQATSTQINDVCQWYGLKARLPDMWVYPNWTTLGVRLRSGGKLGAQSENQINVIATRKLPTLQSNGTWGPEVATRDISAAARYVLQKAGVRDDQIDMEEMMRLHFDVWTPRGDTFDFVFDATTCKDALNTIFRAGLAEFSCGDGLVRPVRETVRTPLEFDQSYDPENMTGPLRTVLSTHNEIQDNDGVDVEYISAETWEAETVECRLPGDLGVKVRRITLDGVLSRTKAYQIGMRDRSQEFYQKTTYSFGTELDALNSNYKGYVGLFGSDAEFGQVAQLVGITATGVAGQALLRSSEPLKWNIDNPVVAYRKADGSFSGVFPAQRGATDYDVLVMLPLPWPKVTLRQELPSLYFGNATEFGFEALITGINPRSQSEISVSAVNYDARVYAYDDALPPQ